jgi:mRNA interferase HicA
MRKFPVKPSQLDAIKNLIHGNKAMESATFRKWLAEHGCRFDRHEHEKRGEGQVMVTVHREGRKAEVPLGGSRQILDVRVVRRACEELGLDWSRLPGPEGRV